MSDSSYKNKRLDHLGLISVFCKEMGLAELIDSAMGKQSKNRNISYGQTFIAMLLNGLGFNGRTLHMYPEYFEDKPLDRLLGKGIEAEHINDDVLGRCLDKLYDVGVSKLYQQLSEKVISHLKLPCNSLHLDSTSFHLDGEYTSEDTDTKAISLVKGYSRDHRPELNQVVLNLITENQAGIPLYMQAASGNTNDMKGFNQIVKSHISSLKAAQNCQYFVGDAALFSSDTITELNEQGQLFITRVPQTLKEAKAVIASKNSHRFLPLDDGYSGIWFDSEYANVTQKWLLIRSEQASKRETHTLDKRMHKDAEKSRKSFKKVCQKTFGCEADAKVALALWQQEQPFQDVKGRIAKVAVYKSVGRPKKGEEPTGYSYQICGELYTPIGRRDDALANTGLFIITTNDCRGELSMAEMLAIYKSQQAVEKGFRFLKSPDFLTSAFYLKKPERIEALLMVMTSCLMVYAALEHLIRQTLTETNAFFPDMKKKDTQRPTARWVFLCFQGIDVLTVDKEHTFILNIKERQEIVIDCLGEPYRQIYS